MTWFDHALTFAAAALGGTVNAVAGGGTLLTFPALLLAHQSGDRGQRHQHRRPLAGGPEQFLGLPRELGQQSRGNRPAGGSQFPGRDPGRRTCWLKTNDATFAALVPWLILAGHPVVPGAGTALALAASRAERLAGVSQPPDPLDAWQHGNAARARWIGALLFQFLVGVYGGYFGAGIGILMLAAFGFLGFTNIHHMNGLKNLNAMCINGIAAALFIWKGLVDWHLALWMATAAIIGGYAGAGTARRAGQKAVRRTIVGIGFALSIWLLVRQLR